MTANNPYGDVPGTFEVVGEHGRAPASQSGQLTLWLLAGVIEEIRRRRQ